MRTKYKAWAEPFLLEHPEIGLSNEEISILDNFVLEIGSGKGEFLVKMANNNPKEFFIGVEKNVTCAGIAGKKMFESELSNAKIIWKDITNLFPLIKDNSISTIFLNFSDPWPKKRHYKRRLTSTLFLNEYKRILKKNGQIIFKTDNDDLFVYSVEMFETNGFKILSKTFDYDGSDTYDAQTEYEEFFRQEGTPIKRVKVTYDK